jgi:hypothetical protein
MQRLLILFYDPNYGIDIEDVLCDQNIEYEINKTPTELLDVDPFFCKTLIVTSANVDVVKELMNSQHLKVEGLFTQTPETGYQSVLEKVV